MKKTSLCFAAALLATPLPLAAQGNDGTTINQPGANWTLYGGSPKNKMIKDGGVPNGKALHVEIGSKGANPWDIGALSPVQKPIANGDVVLIGVFLRDPALKDGETTAVPVGVTGSTAPYAGIAAANADVTNQWKIYYAAGKATQAFPGGGAQASVQLAGDKHVVELGPVVVIDYGPNQDMAGLPHN